MFNWRSRDETFKMWQRTRWKTGSKLEFEWRSLPVVPQLRFNANVNKPRFIKCYYTRVHFQFSFENDVPHERSAKRAIESFGTSGLFFASVLKILKHEFGNTLLVAQLRLKSMLDKRQIKSNQQRELKVHSQVRDKFWQLKAL